MIDARDAVVSVDLAGTVNRAFVEAFRLLSCVLDLETCFDVLDRSGYEADCCTGHDSSQGMS